MTTEFLQTLQTQIPSVAPLVQEISDLYSKKMWHNITDKVDELLALPELTSRPQLMMQVYTDFVSQFQGRINSLRLASMVANIAACQQGAMDADQIISFVDSIIRRINGKDKFEDNKEELERYQMSMKRDQREAELMLETEKAVWIMQRQTESSVSDARRSLREVKERIDGLGFVENIVQAHYYKAMAGLLKHSAQYNEFYKNALLFLAYTPIEQIPLQQQQAYAFDVGIAALIGDRLYNFSELLGHPVVESLKNSPAEWLLHLLFAFNRGDIAAYQQLTQQYSTELNSQPILLEKQAFLHEKIQLMCLMEIVFQRGTAERVIDFADVARATGRQESDVEHLLLKALALGLIRGTIDQVSRKVHVVWVQPRVLDRNQAGNMREKLGAWLGKVNETIGYLRTKGVASSELEMEA